MSELKIHKKEDGWWLEISGKEFSGMFNLGFPKGHIIQNSLEEALKDQITAEEDICGFCGESGADKIPHPIHWPGEQTAGTEYVHAECEKNECKRAHSLLSEKQRIDFLVSLR